MPEIRELVPPFILSPFAERISIIPAPVVLLGGEMVLSNPQGGRTISVNLAICKHCFPKVTTLL
jgi:hypothetical protein